MQVYFCEYVCVQIQAHEDALDPRNNAKVVLLCACVSVGVCVWGVGRRGGGRVTVYAWAQVCVCTHE